MSQPPDITSASMPGLAKVRRVAVATRRILELVGLQHGWFSAMVREADIVSEGAVQVVDGVEGYFGSTSLRCTLTADGAGAVDVARLVVSDPNARLRMLRLAHREAVSRAGVRSLGVLNAEIATALTKDEGGVAVLAIDIDVSAALLERHDLTVDIC